jgi:hypothetical protein
LLYVDEGWDYSDEAKETAVAPFPACTYYELKAWDWMTRPEVLRTFKPGPVVFWNSGN